MKNAGLTKQNVAGCFCPITISSGVFTIVRYFGVLLMRGFGEGMKWFPNIRKKTSLDLDVRQTEMSDTVGPESSICFV